MVALPFIAGIDKKSWYCQILAKLRGLRPPPEFTNLAPGRATSGCRTGDTSDYIRYCIAVFLLLKFIATTYDNYANDCKNSK